MWCFFSNLFILFLVHRVFIAAFSSWGLQLDCNCSAWVSHCGSFSCEWLILFSCPGAQALGVWALVVVALGLNSYDTCASLLFGLESSEPGIQLMFPTLAGTFPSTLPPGKSLPVKILSVRLELLILCHLCGWQYWLQELETSQQENLVLVSRCLEGRREKIRTFIPWKSNLQDCLS